MTDDEIFANLAWECKESQINEMADHLLRLVMFTMQEDYDPTPEMQEQFNGLMTDAVLSFGALTDYAVDTDAAVVSVGAMGQILIAALTARQA